MIENLLLNMSSGVEKNIPVCSTGRMMRVLGSLDKTDAENIVELKPSWAIKEELDSVVNKIRNDELEKCSQNLRKQYDNGEDTPEVDAFLDNIKNKVKQKCNDDYVKSGILSEVELDLKLKPPTKAFTSPV